MNTLLRGNGVMVSPKPCMRLPSDQVAEPALPANRLMPYREAVSVSAASDGVPAACVRSDFLWLSTERSSARTAGSVVGAAAPAGGPPPRPR
ncbi:hypothetical protein GCM10010421_53510 [Streptomyces glaucus]|uniref:Secreted protein n=1 Tax=Streptomyces glaucus TaxID=284029 RepID=A0ABP5XKT0_9ACTN